MPYHEGEIAVQTRAGVVNLAKNVGRIIGGDIPPGAAEFLGQQQFLVTSTVGADGNVTASILGGEPGFARGLDAETLQIEPLFGHVEAVRHHLVTDPRLGVLAIELATRRRIRVNGVARLTDDSIVVNTREVYSNCPQYIQQRVIEPKRGMVQASPEPVMRAALDAGQRSLIENADTFFIASAHSANADASHRGGRPGFAHVDSPQRLWFPDYRGNNMFNTLGNLETNPRAGLLFLHFDTGRTLQVGGTARIVWDDPRVDATPGAQRLIELEIDRVVDTSELMPLGWRFVSASPVNP
jgi:uncharacterized protein